MQFWYALHVILSSNSVVYTVSVYERVSLFKYIISIFRCIASIFDVYFLDAYLSGHDDIKRVDYKASMHEARVPGRLTRLHVSR